MQLEIFHTDISKLSALENNPSKDKLTLAFCIFIKFPIYFKLK